MKRSESEFPPPTPLNHLLQWIEKLLLLSCQKKFNKRMVLYSFIFALPFLYLLLALIKYIRPVFVSRSDQDSRKKTVEEIKRRAHSGGEWPQVDGWKLLCTNYLTSMPCSGQKYKTITLTLLYFNVGVKTTNILYLFIQKHSKGYNCALIG